MSIAQQEPAVTTGIRGPLAELGIRSESGRKRKTLSGPFVPFDEWLEVDSIIEGHFFESFAPGSADKTIREQRNKMRAILHHGREGLGTMPIGKITDLHADQTHGYYEVELFDGLPTVFLEGLEADQYGTSMKFEVMRMADPRQSRLLDTDENPHGLSEHRVLEFKVIELGPTPFAAYEGASHVGLRSLTDDVMLERLAEDPERLRKLAERSGISLAGVNIPLEVEIISDTAAGNAAGNAPTYHFDVNATNVISATQPQPIRQQAIVPESRQTARRYERAFQYVAETVWAMHPATLAVILQIIGERRQGYRPTPEEIAERIGERATPEERDVTDSPVAVVPIRGSILPRADMFSNMSETGTSIESLRQTFRDAMASEDVKAVMFDVDSPGGSVEWIEEMATEIRDARGTKPIVAIANGFAASAAYYLASQADELVVTPSGKVGSIGVYTAHEDISGRMAQLGISTTLVSAGKYKVEGNPFEPLSEEAAAEAQSHVDAYYQMFVKAVAKGRGTTTKTVESDFGQGRMVMAEKAVERDMADRVATFDQTLTRLEKESRTVSTRAAAPDERAPERSDATTLERSRRSTQPTTKNYLEKEKEPWRL